jgi:hypothetical protein
VVIGDGPLFAAEAVRVMAAGAALVWSNALGGSALFFVPVKVMAQATATATGHGWYAVHSQAHWGNWAVSVLSSDPGAAAGLAYSIDVVPRYRLMA